MLILRFSVMFVLKKNIIFITEQKTYFMKKPIYSGLLFWHSFYWAVETKIFLTVLQTPNGKKNSSGKQ